MAVWNLAVPAVIRPCRDGWLIFLPGQGHAWYGTAEAASRDAERRRTTSAAFDQVITEIRRLPGFEGFLRSPPVAELLAVMALAEDPQWCSANFPTWLVVRLSG